MKKLKEGHIMDKFRTLGTDWWEPEQHKQLGEARLREREYIINFIKPEGKAILDAATGKGRFAIELAKRRAAQVWAVDISLDMIKEAKRRADQELVGSSINFLTGDVEKLSFPSEQFDITLCVETFVHLPNPLKAAAELARVTRRGGLVVANVRVHQLDLDKMRNYPLYLWMELRKVLRGERIPDQYKWIHRYMTRSEFRSLFDRNNFEIVEIRDWGPPTYNFLIIASKRHHSNSPVSIPGA